MPIWFTNRIQLSCCLVGCCLLQLTKNTDFQELCLILNPALQEPLYDWTGGLWKPKHPKKQPLLHFVPTCVCCFFWLVVWGHVIFGAPELCFVFLFWWMHGCMIYTVPCLSIKEYGFLLDCCFIKWYSIWIQYLGIESNIPLERRKWMRSTESERRKKQRTGSVQGCGPLLGNPGQCHLARCPLNVCCVEWVDHSLNT